MAVAPPTRTVMPVPAWALGITSLRSRLSSDCGLGRLGAGRGVEAGDGDGPARAQQRRGDCDHARLAGERCSTAANAASSAGDGSSATSWNGPLNPGPKPLASRS